MLRGKSNLLSKAASLKGECSFHLSADLETAVWGVTVDPHTPRVLYAITAAGVIASADHGSTWSAFSEGLSTDVIGVAVDPFLTGTLFAGTSGHGLFVESPTKSPAREAPAW